MLSLWNPFFTEKSDRKISSRNYLDRLLTDPFETMFTDAFNSPMGIEYVKNEDGLLSINVDIPGIKEEDLNIELCHDLLTIKGQRKTQSTSYEVKKSFNIPEGYTSDDIKASLKDGVLTITLISKSTDKEVKKILINK